jgi:hypothetical protein
MLRGMATKMMNFRAEETLADAVDVAAEKAGVSRSVWLREVVAMVAFGLVDLSAVTAGTTPDDRPSGTPSPHPARFLALQAASRTTVTVDESCKHPVTAKKSLPFTDVCGLCGAVLRQR